MSPGLGLVSISDSPKSWGTSDHLVGIDTKEAKLDVTNQNSVNHWAYNN